MSIRILCVDDNPAIIKLIKYALRFLEDELPDKVELFVAYDGEQALECILQLRPDLVLVDVKMPRMDGYQLVHSLRCDPRTARTLLVFLTAMVREEEEILGLQLGADDYLTKPFTPSRLVAHINAVLRRGREGWKTDLEGILRYADVEMDSGARLAYRGHNSLDLTSKEFDLLVLFLRHPRQVLSRNNIIECVWGFDYEGESGNIVDVYIGYLRKKLEKYGPRIIHTTRGIGFVLKELKPGK